jgi:hypothetical protein
MGKRPLVKTLNNISSQSMGGGSTTTTNQVTNIKSSSSLNRTNTAAGNDRRINTPQKLPSSKLGLINHIGGTPNKFDTSIVDGV